MWKIVIAALIVIPLVGGMGYYVMNSKPLPFESVCKKGHDQYTDLCDNVGKRAWSLPNMISINDKDYGPILGVAWRKKGSIISSRGRDRRYSERNAYYYIIGSDKSDYTYLRLASEIEPH